MVIYFSGTGNSRRCAQIIADTLQDQLLDAAGYIKSGIAADLVSGRPWVFVSPTYAWQLPRIFAAFIQSGSFSGCPDAYFVLTCGSEIGNASASTQSLCRQTGLRFRGVLPVVMPENYIALFDVPSAETCKSIISAACPVLNTAIDCIRRQQSFPAVKVTLIDRLKSGPVNKGFYAAYVSARPFRTTDACTGCGICVDLCPLNNISLQNGLPVWNTRCTHCMACISRCPSSAIEYGKRSVGKRRYRCEDYPDK